MKQVVLVAMMMVVLGVCGAPVAPAQGQTPQAVLRWNYSPPPGLTMADIGFQVQRCQAAPNTTCVPVDLPTIVQSATTEVAYVDAAIEANQLYCWTYAAVPLTAPGWTRGDAPAPACGMATSFGPLPTGSPLTLHFQFP